jgi:hypothetical protein
MGKDESRRGRIEETKRREGKRELGSSLNPEL